MDDIIFDKFDVINDIIRGWREDHDFEAFMKIVSDYFSISDRNVKVVIAGCVVNCVAEMEGQFEY